MKFMPHEKWDHYDLCVNIHTALRKCCVDDHAADLVYGLIRIVDSEWGLFGRVLEKLFRSSPMDTNSKETTGKLMVDFMDEFDWLHSFWPFSADGPEDLTTGPEDKEEVFQVLVHAFQLFDDDTWVGALTFCYE